MVEIGKDLQAAVELLKDAIQANVEVAEASRMVTDQYTKQAAAQRTVKETLRDTTLHFSQLGISMSRQSDALKQLGASEQSISQFRREQLHILQEERRHIALLGQSTKDLDRSIAEITKQLPVQRRGFEDLWAALKSGKTEINDFVKEAGGVGAVFEGFTKLFGRVAIGALALKELTKILEDLTVGTARYQGTMESIAPTLSYGQLGKFGGVTAGGAGFNRTQELITLGKMLGYSSEEVRQTGGVLGKVGLAQQPEGVKYVETALIGQRTMGLEAGKSAEILRLMAFRGRDQLKTADQVNSEYLRMREIARVNNLSNDMVADAYQQILSASGGMSQNFTNTSKIIQLFSKEIQEGTFNFGTLIQGIRGMEPSKIVGFTEILRSLSPGSLPKEFKGTQGSFLTTLNRFYGLDTVAQASTVAKSARAIAAQSGLMGEERTGFERLQLMQIPGLSQIATYAPKKFEEILTKLTGGGKLTEAQEALVKEASAPDMALLESAKDAAVQLGLVNDTLDTIRGHVAGIAQSVGGGFGGVGEWFGKNVLSGRFLHADPLEIKARNDWMRQNQ